MKMSLNSSTSQHRHHHHHPHTHHHHRSHHHHAQSAHHEPNINVRLPWFFSFCNQRSSTSSYKSSLPKYNPSKNAEPSNVFGLDLTEHTRRYSQDDLVPQIVKTCSKFIEEHGIINGIYRLSGTRMNIRAIRETFDNDPRKNMIDNEAICNDAHAVACVLKQYFRELPTPLLTFQMYEKFINLFRHDIAPPNNSPNDTTLAANTNTTRATRTSTNTVASTITSGINKSFTTSVSDSQLLSLSSIANRTIPDTSSKHQAKLDSLKQLLQQLPKAHYQTLKFLVKHLASIAENGHKTGMDAKNISIVWAPNLLKPKELHLSQHTETLQTINMQAVITEKLIKYNEFLFDT